MNNIKKNIYDSNLKNNSETFYNSFNLRIIDGFKRVNIRNGVIFLSEYLPIILTSKGYLNLLSDNKLPRNIELCFPDKLDDPKVKESYLNYYKSYHIDDRGIEKTLNTFELFKKFHNQIITVDDVLYYKKVFNIDIFDLEAKDIIYNDIFKCSEKIKAIDFPNIYRKLDYPYIYRNLNLNEEIVYLTGYSKNNFKIYEIDFEDIEIDYILNMIENKLLTPFIELYISYMSIPNNKEFYRTFYVPKKDGTRRKISEPIEEIKKPCKSILYFMNKAFNTKLGKRQSGQYAYIEKTGIRDNANVHRLSEKVIKFDISKFFDNCRFYDFKKYLEFYYKDCNASVKNELEDMFFDILIDKETRGLYMGNPLSGILSNMIIFKCAYYMKNLAELSDIKFSIYADDITFSGSKDNKDLNVKNCKNIIKYAFDYYEIKFEVNDKKTRVLFNNGRRITGIRINHNNQLTPDRNKYMLMKSICDHLRNNKPITMDKNELQGKLSFYLYIDTSGKFKKLVNKYKKELNDFGVIISSKYFD